MRAELAAELRNDLHEASEIRTITTGDPMNSVSASRRDASRT